EMLVAKKSTELVILDADAKHARRRRPDSLRAREQWSNHPEPDIVNRLYGGLTPPPEPLSLVDCLRSASANRTQVHMGRQGRQRQANENCQYPDDNQFSVERARQELPPSVPKLHESAHRSLHSYNREPAKTSGNPTARPARWRMESARIAG